MPGVAPRAAAWALRYRNLPGPVPAGIAAVSPDPVEIQWCWIQSPLIRKPTVAVTKAVVTQDGGAVGYSSASAALVRQYGVNTVPITVFTDCDADPGNLAEFLTSYQSTPRPRQPALTFDLTGLEDDEVLTILSVQLGQRAVIVDAPAAVPAGARSFTVEGIAHRLGVTERLVTWQTAATIGAVAGTPGPWFRWDESYWDGSDVRPF